MTDKLIISAYGSHNAAVSMFYNGNYTVVEVERWLNIKNAGLSTYLPSRNMQLVFDEICEYLLNQTNKSIVDVYIHGYMGSIRPKFKFNQQITCDHHVAHAAGAFYQSPYQRSLVFTYDGGGDGGFFNVYMADRNNGIHLLHKIDQDLGFPYMVLGGYLKDIKKEALNIGNLVYAGKLMGLCSYGKVREEWLPHFDDFYATFNYSGDSFIGGAEASYIALPKLFEAIGVSDFDIDNSSFEGQFAWDIAATTQKAFEMQFLKYAKPYMDRYPDVPISLSGGCALNVLLNTILLKERNGAVFVPPNTNDCGISVGAILWYLEPDVQVDLTYSGLPILDDILLSEYMESGKFSIIPNINAKDIARFIADGNILGVVQGRSEHGSRALGNRSIICNPVEGMKDTLNHKVKKREWYRPFAPIVRLEDTHKYFNFHGTESRHMVFVAEVKDEWKETIPAITHEDGTGRLQTVTRKQNELIYDVITEFDKLTGHAVILNTSFNVNGKPILTRLSDALHILEHSKMDGVFYKGNILIRSCDEKTYRKYRNNETTLLDNSDDTTVYLTIFDDNLPSNVGRYTSQIEEIVKVDGVNVVIITDRSSVGTFTHLLNSRVAVHAVDKHRLYYSKVINKVYPNISSIIDFAKYVRLLWAKEAIRENVFKTHNYVIIDSSRCPTVGLPSTLENIIHNIKSELRDNGSSLVSASKKPDIYNMLDETFYDKKFSVIPSIFYNGTIIGGQFDDLDWLLTNYEGVLNWYLSHNIISAESDFLTISMYENSERFRPFFI